MLKNRNTNIIGLRVDDLRLEDLLKFISDKIHQGEKARLVYANIHAMNLAQELAWFRGFYNNSEVVYCDGYGVKWAAHFLGMHVPERMSPPDWIRLLTGMCEREKFSLFFLGASPGVAERAARILRQEYKQLCIQGTQDGYFNKSSVSVENETILRAINQVQPDILLVGMGMPVQEQWLNENWDHLDIKIALTVGALFDYLAGEVRRPPSWMTNHGLEWFGRLSIEPRRLWRRYLLGIPRFLWSLLKQRLGILNLE